VLAATSRVTSPTEIWDFHHLWNPNFLHDKISSNFSPVARDAQPMHPIYPNIYFFASCMAQKAYFAAHPTSKWFMLHMNAPQTYGVSSLFPLEIAIWRFGTNFQTHKITSVSHS
jgi:hypothetical protein